MIISISTINRNPAVVGDGIIIPAAIAMAAPYAPAGASISATSETAVTIETGPKAFVVQHDLGFHPGMRVRATVDGASGLWVEGVIASYSDDDLMITVDLTSGFGSYADWLINIAGQPGAAGPPGEQGVQGEPGLVEEAPIDGGIYGRQNGNWAPAGIGALTAAGIASTPAGDIAATNVQAALNELDLEKLAKAGGTMTGHLSLPVSPAAANAVRKDYVDAADAALTTSIGNKVEKGGDTMTGHLSLPTGPAAANATRKDYVDATATAAAATKLDKGGGTMTGHITLPTAPAAAQAVRKDYVDAFNNITTSALADKLDKAGGTMTGPLVLSGAPAIDLHAATKLYVDNAASVGGVVRFDTYQALTDDQRAMGRANVYAAPFDAFATLGMQVNGDHWISQALGASVANIPVNTSQYVTDQWRFGSTGAPFGTGAQVDVVPNGGFQKSLIYIAGNTVASPAASDTIYVGQRVDHGRMAHLGWGTAAAQPMTVSFWIQSSLSGTIPVSVRTGVGARSYVVGVTVPVASTWTYRSVTIPVDPSFVVVTDPNQQVMDLGFAYCAGSTYRTPTPGAWVAGNYMSHTGALNVQSTAGHWVRITGLRIFPGLSAPTAEQSANCFRSYADELRQCQRYWQTRQDIVTQGWGAAGTNYSSGIALPTTMRAAPAVTFAGISYTNSSALALFSTRVDHYSVSFTTTATGSIMISMTAHVNARM